MKVALVTVLLIHGGGWVSGSPSSMDAEAQALRAQGLNAWSVPYTLDNMSRAVSDIRADVREARKRGPVVLWGHSAGATLAADLAARGEADAAIVAEGPADLNRWRSVGGWGTAAHWRMLGLDHAGRKRFSPIARLSRHSAPLRLFYGDRDPIVPMRQGKRLRAAAERLGIHVKLTTMRGAGHEFPARYVEQGARWVKREFCPTADTTTCTPASSR